jgi:hypothetical protein
MRRIAIALSLVALVAMLHACAADAPTKPPAGGGGGGGNNSALSVTLFTSDANPKAGTCTLVEAVVSLNGNPVPDGTSVVFTTDFGSFSQNGLPSVSVVSSGGQAVTALCGPGAGQAKVKATATSAGKTNSANLVVQFQPDAGTLPFVSSCSPSTGNPAGNETITLNGGRFFGTTSTTRVQFTANGITRDGIVTGVTANAVTVQTPQFPELTAPSTLTAITLTLGTNLSTPVVLSLPNCFAFGTSPSNQPSITAVLPSSGTFEGNTRVTIIGSGFSTAGVQVFFGNVEATVISTTFNQVVALSPAAPPGSGSGGVPVPVAVTVKNINSGLVSGGVTFTYTKPIIITSASNTTQPAEGPFAQVTIFGQGFQAPVAVTLAGVAASVNSVSATEIVVTPSLPLIEGCGDQSAPIQVVNINSGDGATGPTFTYVVSKVAITSIQPTNDGGGTVTSVTITGTGFSAGNAIVKFGAKTAFVTGGGVGIITVTVPPGTVTTQPSCTAGHAPPDLLPVETVDVTVTNGVTTCTATAAQAFVYLLPCVVPTPTPAAP